ncbi:MAG TPA: RIP metalloprotease RseP [Candidatus Limnocylindria bacterium]|nr:RIP metalloprotease RseP [Candidatus Limnocylindria bacterium]
MANFQNAVIAIFSVTIVLGIMIFVHEWGHFIAAKLAGVRVEIFSLGFGMRVFGTKRGDTDYRISALPFGGYVRMAGDNPVEERTGAPDEFLSKPRWVRVLIAVAGPAMNILLAVLIFWGLFWLRGIPIPTYLREPAVVAAVPEASASTSNIQPGDRIVEVNGVKTPTWENALTEAGKAKPGDSLSVTILRNGAQNTFVSKVPAKHDVFALVGYPAMAPVVDEVAIGFPAEKAGLKPGDLVVSMNGKPVVTWPQLVDRVHQSGGQPIQFVVRRNGTEIPLAIAPMQGMDPEGGSVWQIGVSPRTKDDYERQGFVASSKDAAVAALLTMREIKGVLAGLFTGKVSIRQLQGVVGIARESGRAAKSSPERLVELMAIISINLGILNLLPIPILDGGHVLLLAIEGLLRRDLSIAVKERFVQVGLVFLLGIFAFVMYSDILKLIQHH